MHQTPAQMLTVVQQARPVHRSFRLTRPGQPAVASQVRPAIVLTERDARELLSSARRADVALGGCFSAGPAGVQVWDRPWTGASRGDSEHLGSVDWSYDTPVRHYITIYRVLVTPQGVTAGETPRSLLARVLGLAGLSEPDLSGAPASRSLGVPPPRDPFRSADQRERDTRAHGGQRRA